MPVPIDTSTHPWHRASNAVTHARLSHSEAYYPRQYHLHAPIAAWALQGITQLRAEYNIMYCVASHGIVWHRRASQSIVQSTMPCTVRHRMASCGLGASRRIACSIVGVTWHRRPSRGIVDHRTEHHRAGHRIMGHIQIHAHQHAEMHAIHCDRHTMIMPCTRTQGVCQRHQ